MAYLNTRGLQSLWDRIGQIFGRKTQSAGSASMSGTTLYLVAISGNTLSSINLGSTFATDAEAVGSVTFSGTTLTVKNVNGGTIGTIDLDTAFLTDTAAASTYRTQSDADRMYGAKISYDTSNDRLTLLTTDDYTRSTTTIPLSDYRTVSDANRLYGNKISFDSSNNRLTLLTVNDETRSTTTIPIPAATDTSGLAAYIGYEDPYVYLYNSGGSVIDSAYLPQSYVPSYSLYLSGKSLSLLRDGLAVSTVTLP